MKNEKKNVENETREKKKWRFYGLWIERCSMVHGIKHVVFGIWLESTGVGKYLFILHKNETKWAFDEVQNTKTTKLVLEKWFCSGLRTSIIFVLQFNGITTALNETYFQLPRNRRGTWPWWCTILFTDEVKNRISYFFFFQTKNELMMKIHFNKNSQHNLIMAPCKKFHRLTRAITFIKSFYVSYWHWRIKQDFWNFRRWMSFKIVSEKSVEYELSFKLRCLIPSAR